MNKSPCKGCTKRFVGCHGQCPEYAPFDALNKEIYEKRLKELDLKGYYERKYLKFSKIKKNKREAEKK